MRLRFLLAPLALLLGGPSAFAASESAYVAADQFGQAILRGDHGECFGITPAHVVANAFDVRLTAVGGHGIAVENWETCDPDIAILKLAPGTTTCPALQTASLTPLLERLRTAHLRIVDPAGGLGNVAVTIKRVSDRFVSVAPANGEAIRQGMSGAPLVANGAIIGQLQSFDPETQLGKVIRLDYLIDSTRWYFARNQRAVPSSGHPEFDASSIDPSLVIRGTVANLVAPASPQSIEMWAQTTPVRISLRLGNAARRAVLRAPIHVNSVELPETATIEGAVAPDAPWQRISRITLLRRPGSDNDLGVLPAGFDRLRVTFGFSENASRFHLGSLHFD